MTRMRLQLFTLATLLTCGAQTAAAQAQPAAAPAAQREGHNVPAIAPPPAGMGQIVFYRTSRMGFAVNCTVREGEEVLSRLNPGKYFVQVTTPGQHEYRVRSETHRVLNVPVREGETQYVRCAIGMGFMVGRPNLSLADAADFQQRGEGLEPMPSRAEQVAGREHDGGHQAD